MLRLSSQTQQSRVRAQLELLLRNAEPGERLPSEPALAKRFDVSRTTIREVMSQLETEGFVQRRQGSGTYVRHQPLLEDESLLHFVDFPTLISKQGHTPAMRQLGFVQQRAGAFFSTRFHIGEEDRILTRRCLYTADEHFCVLAEDSFPLERSACTAAWVKQYRSAAFPFSRNRPRRLSGRNHNLRCPTGRLPVP